MEHFFDSIGNYILAHANMGLLFAFLIAFAESLPLLGTIIPGSVTMTLIGMLSGRNVLPFGTTLALAVAGALIGDLIGFWLGQRYQDSIADIWPFRQYAKMRKLITLGEKFFLKHGGKSIIIGRFIGPTRSSVPMIAGLLRMSWFNFIIAAIPSAFLWALLYLLPGVLIGAISLALPKGKATEFTLIAFGIIVLLWLIFWLVQRFFVYIVNAINRATDRCWNWLNTHHSSRFVIRWITHKRNPSDHHQLTLLLLALVLFALFLLLTLSVVFHRGLYCLNEPIFHLTQALRTQHLDVALVVITELGNKYLLAAVYLILVLMLAIRRQWYLCWHFILLLLIAFACVGFTKQIYYSPRPTGFMHVASSSSFPSGHTTLAMSLLGFLSFLMARTLNPKWRWIPYTSVYLLIGAVAFSRVMLGAHWFCDVMAGLCLGSMLLTLTIISYRRWQPIIYAPRLLLRALILAILIPWAYAASSHYHDNLYHYKPFYPRNTVTLNAWWSNPTDYFEIYRLNRLGHRVRPFNVQWAGQLRNIRITLQKAGWQRIESKESLQRALARFATKAPREHIAFLPELHQGKAPALFMVYEPKGSQTILELRLWQTNTYTQADKLPVFVGTLNYHDPARSLFDLKPQLQISLRGDAGAKQLINAVSSDFAWKQIQLDKKAIPERLQYLDWDANVLLLKRR